MHSISITAHKSKFLSLKKSNAKHLYRHGAQKSKFCFINRNLMRSISIATAPKRVNYFHWKKFNAQHLYSHGAQKSRFLSLREGYENENVLLILYRCEAGKEKEADKVQEEVEEEQKEQEKQKVSHIGPNAEFTSHSHKNGYIFPIHKKEIRSFLTSEKKSC